MISFSQKYSARHSALRNNSSRPDKEFKWNSTDEPFSLMIQNSCCNSWVGKEIEILHNVEYFRRMPLEED